MNTYGRYPLTISHGKGCKLFDSEGKEYLDFCAGIATCILGHSSERLKSAIMAQLDLVHHCSNLYYIPAQAQLAAWLTSNSALDKAFFCNSGAEANEAAIKLARKYAHTKLGYDFPVIITAVNSFHGRTITAITATGQTKYQKNFGPLTPVDKIQSNSEGRSGLAAILIEPIQGEGGVLPATKEFFKAIREVCDQTGALMMVDEVQTGMGRTGTLWAYEQLSVEPDVLTSAKALGGGVPIGAMLCKDFCNIFTPGDHASTYGGNPLACAAGLAVAKAIEEEKLLDNVIARGKQFRELANRLSNKYPDVITGVRGWGLLTGVQLSESSSITASEVTAGLMSAGVLVVPAGTKVVRFIPPLIVTEDEVCPKGIAWVGLSSADDEVHTLVECSNMGICDYSTGLCQCREGFEGTACERLSCPNDCNNVGECQSLYYYAQTKDPGSGTIYSYTDIWDYSKIYGCNCDDKYSGYDCSLRNYIQSALENLPSLGSDSVKITMLNTLYACTESGSIWTIEFIQNFGDQPLIIPTTSTKENDLCSNRGVCDFTSGVCDCSTNFESSNGYNEIGTRGDCGYESVFTQYCPGLISCSGWQGADCSERTCPLGLTWFNYPTSDNDVHLSTYSDGSSCDRLSCPSITNDEGVVVDCSGHGTCYDISTLATLSTVNGVLAGFTYGATANDQNTWDYNRIYGCYCDDGYDGSDPLVTTGVNAKQTISCTIDSSYYLSPTLSTFQLTFRNQQTSALSPTITLSELTTALESLSTIRGVLIETFYNNGSNSLCTTTGNTFVVTFLTEHGSLPLMTYTAQNITSFAVSALQNGTKQNLVCSGRGLCDRSTGICDCFQGFGSSNGEGNFPGTFGDC
eukprot:gene21371-27688_t